MNLPKFRIQLKITDKSYKLSEAKHKGKRNRKRLILRRMK